MDKLKLLFQLILLISFGILLGVGIEGIVFTLLGESFVMEWHFPISVIVTSVLCSVPTLVLVKEYNEKRIYYICSVIHAVLLFVIVAIMGYLFRWYASMEFLMPVFWIYVLVHIFVRGGLWFLAKKDETKINQALKDYSDKE